MLSKVGISLQSLSYWFLNQLMDNLCSDGVLEVIGSFVPNLMKDVQNLRNDVPNFVNDVLRVSKCVLRWGLALNHFLVGF